ncbi:hypothetical protein JTB14_034863 [Gonioctena quinquepunctata]|nr:hypothetical protein JTB14_034863 [Gonioctena quinquepunctata]
MCSRNITYKCCKTKQCNHYVCTNCTSIFHHSCIPRFRNKIQFIEGNKIVCCESDKSVSDEKQVSLLEQTITELSNDGLMKDNFIDKLNKDREIVLNEALKLESEMSDLVEQHNKTIEDMKAEIIYLQQKITDGIKNTATISTQTKPVNKKKPVNLNRILSDELQWCRGKRI